MPVVHAWLLNCSCFERHENFSGQTVSEIVSDSHITSSWDTIVEANFETGCEWGQKIKKCD